MNFQPEVYKNACLQNCVQLGHNFLWTAYPLSGVWPPASFCKPDPFPWRDTFSLEVIIDHSDDRGITVPVMNDDWHDFWSRQFTGSLAPMA